MSSSAQRARRPDDDCNMESLNVNNMACLDAGVSQIRQAFVDESFRLRSDFDLRIQQIQTLHQEEVHQLRSETSRLLHERNQLRLQLSKLNDQLQIPTRNSLLTNQHQFAYMPTSSNHAHDSASNDITQHTKRMAHQKPNHSFARTNIHEYDEQTSCTSSDIDDAADDNDAVLNVATAVLTSISSVEHTELLKDIADALETTHTQLEATRNFELGATVQVGSRHDINSSTNIYMKHNKRNVENHESLQRKDRSDGPSRLWDSSGSIKLRRSVSQKFRLGRNSNYSNERELIEMKRFEPRQTSERPFVFAESGMRGIESSEVQELIGPCAHGLSGDWSEWDVRRRQEKARDGTAKVAAVLMHNYSSDRTMGTTRSSDDIPVNDNDNNWNNVDNNSNKSNNHRPNTDMCKANNNNDDDNSKNSNNNINHIDNNNNNNHNDSNNNNKTNHTATPADTLESDYDGGQNRMGELHRGQSHHNLEHPITNGDWSTSSSLQRSYVTSTSGDNNDTDTDTDHLTYDAFEKQQHQQQQYAKLNSSHERWNDDTGDQWVPDVVVIGNDKKVMLHDPPDHNSNNNNHSSNDVSNSSSNNDNKHNYSNCNNSNEGTKNNNNSNDIELSYSRNTSRAGQNEQHVQRRGSSDQGNHGNNLRHQKGSFNISSQPSHAVSTLDTIDDETEEVGQLEKRLSMSALRPSLQQQQQQQQHRLTPRSTATSDDIKSHTGSVLHIPPAVSHATNPTQLQPATMQDTASFIEQKSLASNTDQNHKHSRSGAVLESMNVRLSDREAFLGDAKACLAFETYAEMLLILSEFETKGGKRGADKVLRRVRQLLGPTNEDVMFQFMNYLLGSIR